MAQAGALPVPQNAIAIQTRRDPDAGGVLNIHGSLVASVSGVAACSACSLTISASARYRYPRDLGALVDPAAALQPGFLRRGQRLSIGVGGRLFQIRGSIDMPDLGVTEAAVQDIAAYLYTLK